MLKEIVKIDRFNGLNLSVFESQISDSESPNMLNLDIDNEGALNKRLGYELSCIANGTINGQHHYIKKTGEEKHLITYGTRLGEFKNGVITEIFNGLANTKTSMFTLNDKTYILDGTNYLQYDGTTVSVVEPYIPTLTRNGAAYEDFNLLGNKFKDVFSPNGTDKEFYLSVVDIDSTLVKASFDGGSTFNMTEGTGFTVNRTDGKCTFTTAPDKGLGTLVLLAEKTLADKSLMIKNCTISEIYGGSNDTRVILSGNANYPNRIYRSGLYNAEYFPENGFSDLGSNDEHIMGITKQYDSAIVLKERSVWNYYFEINGGEPFYHAKPLNDEIGCIAKESIQIINNNPTWLSKKGVATLVNSNVRDERNVQIISERVNAKLLNTSNLETATSIDNLGKYILCIDGLCYVWDYVKNIWLLWDNIKANNFIEVNRNIFFAENDKLMRFYNSNDVIRYRDNGQAIKSFWNSKMFDFDKPHMLKTIKNMVYNLKPNVNTGITIYYYTNVTGEQLILDKRLSTFSFSPFSFEPFSFISNRYPISEKMKLKAKKVPYIQLKVENNVIDEAIGILGFEFEVQTKKMVKKNSLK